MIGSLGELSQLAGMPSEPTLRKLIAEHADFPIVSRGANGVSYEIDFDQAVPFIQDLKAKKDAAVRARAEEVRQYGLELLGADAAAAPETAGLTPSERKALMEEELVAIKVAQARGELIRKSSIEEAVGTTLVWFAERGRSFSARLAKRVDVPREVLIAIDSLMAVDQRELANKMERIAGRDNDAGGIGEGDTA